MEFSSTHIKIVAFFVTSFFFLIEALIHYNMGKSGDFSFSIPEKKTVCKIIESHIGKLHTNQITIKNSSKGKYTSITIRIIATSRKQLDAINHDLQTCPLVSYLL